MKQPARLDPVGVENHGVVGRLEGRPEVGVTEVFLGQAGQRVPTFDDHVGAPLSRDDLPGALLHLIGAQIRHPQGDAGVEQLRID